VEWSAREIDLLRARELEDLGALVHGLLLHGFHQVGSLDAMGKAGVVLDFGGDGELAAGLMPPSRSGRRRKRGIDAGR
jgi:hypothetical protein